MLIDGPHKLAVVIENKIGSAAHSNQLAKYLDTVNATYSDWKVLPLFLTPSGSEPSHPSYLPVDYGLVCRTVETVAESRRAVLDPAVSTLMVHYARMLRREVVTDSEIADLCQRIYQKHKRALDLIFDHLPSLQEELSPFLRNLVEAEPLLVLDGASKSSVRFSHEAWETSIMKFGEGWSSSGRMLLFEFSNRTERLDLILYVGPGPTDIRQHLTDQASSHPMFTPTKKATTKWTRLFTRSFLTAEDYEEATLDDVEPKIRAKWESFVTNELPVIGEILRVERLPN